MFLTTTGFAQKHIPHLDFIIYTIKWYEFDKTHEPIPDSRGTWIFQQGGLGVNFNSEFDSVKSSWNQNFYNRENHQGIGQNYEIDPSMTMLNYWFEPNILEVTRYQTSPQSQFKFRLDTNLNPGFWNQSNEFIDHPSGWEDKTRIDSLEKRITVLEAEALLFDLRIDRIHIMLAEQLGDQILELHYQYVDIWKRSQEANEKKYKKKKQRK